MNEADPSEGPVREEDCTFRTASHHDSSSSAMEKDRPREGQGPPMADVLLSLKRPVVHTEDQWTASSHISANNQSEQLPTSVRRFATGASQSDQLSAQDLEFPNKVGEQHKSTARSAGTLIEQPSFA